MVKLAIRACSASCRIHPWLFSILKRYSNRQHLTPQQTNTKNSMKREFTILGAYTVRWNSDTGEQGDLVRESIDLNKQGDHGADPMPDGMFKMVPSGDIVTKAERDARLRR